MNVKHTLKPIYDKNSKILILGSIPSIVSRNNNFYYANKSNRFWKIIEALFNTKLQNNLEKETFLLTNHIALWDVIESCDITNSSDASIKNIKVNNIPKLLKESNIEYIFCTGKKAFNIFNKHFKLNIPIIYLPSPSSANASMSLDKLICEYQKIKETLKI